MQEHAAERGIQFTDDPALSVNAVRFEDGQWVLTPGLTSYYRWAVSSGALDVPLNDHESLTLPGVGSTLRQRLGIRVDGPQGLDGLPVPVKAGCGAAVVTTDGQLILGVRNKAFVAGGPAGERARVHVVAEGMVGGDTDASEVISPRAAAHRGLFEELGIRTAEIIEAGWFIDTQRLQPVFAHLAYVPVTFDEVVESKLTAHDGWEADRLIALPFAPGPTMDALLAGTHPELVLASNHAQAFVQAALDTACGQSLATA